MSEFDELYKSIQSKIKERRLLPIDSLILSEFNTRTGAIDPNHVDYLANKIKERGFHPERAISVNVIINVSMKEHIYRVVAGVHRLFAAEKAGLKEIPCILYYGLTDEEECLLDKWNNEMDEDHKPFNFLEESDHLKYLGEVKLWGTKKIAKYKNISRRLVDFKLQIATIPEEAKSIIKKSFQYKNSIFYERYFRDICRLKNPDHIIHICKEIFERGLQSQEKEMDDGEIIQPIKKGEIKERVEKLLEIEKNNLYSSDKIEDIIPENTLNAENKSNFHINEISQEYETNMIYFVQCDPGRTERNSDKKQTNNDNFQPKNTAEVFKIQQEEFHPNFKNPDLNLQPVHSESYNENDQEISLEALQEQVEEEYSQKEIERLEKLSKEGFWIKEEESQEKNGMDEYRTYDEWTTKHLFLKSSPRWIGRSKILKRLRKSEWYIYNILLFYAFRFHKTKKDDQENFFFFIEDYQYSFQEVCGIIGEEAYLSPITVQRNISSLEKKEFIRVNLSKTPPFVSFQIRWDKLAKIFQEEKEQISFSAGGLKDIPKDYRGPLQATPLHSLVIDAGECTNILSKHGLIIFQQLSIIKELSSKTAISLLKKYGEEKIDKALKKYVAAIIESEKTGKHIKNAAGFLISLLEKNL